MMTKKPVKKSTNFLKIILLVIMAGAISSCQSRSEKFYKKAYDEINQGHFLEAVDLLETSAELEKNNQRWSKAIFEAARILRFEIQDYNKALVLYRDLILKSEDAKIRLNSQEAISEIYFDNLQDYTTALKELLLLEPLQKNKFKNEETRLKIAQAYRYTGNLAAALEYVDISLKNAESARVMFLKLRAQIFTIQKKYDDALKIYEQIKIQDPNYFKSDNIFNAVSMVYEEKQDYKQALAYLEENKELIVDKAYLELRIKKLHEKQVNKPFSKGMRK